VEVIFLFVCGGGLPVLSWQDLLATLLLLSQKEGAAAATARESFRN